MITSHGRAPLVSIGVPAHNAERFVTPALESLLAQEEGDLEVIVSDNASTDGTEQLCRDLSRQDRRLRYVRQPSNRGGAANFNAVFAQRHPGARYFKWAAADDTYDPRYLGAVLDVLRGDATVSVAHSLTDDIDEDGLHLRSWGDQGLPVADPDVAVRFAALSQRNYQCFSIFGLMRVETLAATRGLGYYAESDRVLLTELALRGRLVDVPEELFHRREHGGRSVRTHPTARDKVAWFNPALVGRPVFPEWRLGRGYVTALRDAPLSTSEQRRCLVQMGRWTFVRGPHLVRNLARTGAEVASGRTPLRPTA